MTYAELVREEPLDLELQLSGSVESGGVFILGAPHVVPVSQYRVIGTDVPNPRIPAIVRATATWVGDIKLPGMLHGRMVHPRTLGSTLVSVGHLPPGKFPKAQVMVRGSLVGVVAPEEWGVMRAAEALALTTKWTDWRGLPGHERLVEAMLDLDWSQAPVSISSGDEGAVDAVLATSSRRLDSYFSLPFYKHAPMSPEVAVADVRSDGSVHIWAFSQKPQDLRVKIATMLRMDPANVVVHHAEGAAGFGRTNRGDAGPEGEAVLLSQASGHPVRLQWTREEDFAWSAQQASYLGSVSVALDERGRMVALKAEHHHPGIYDDQLLAALLAGLPTMSSPPDNHYLSRIFFEWPYDGVRGHFEVGRGAEGFGHAESPLHIGLRSRSLRSPQHMQQSFAVESMVNEAAAAAGADPIQFRIDHTTDRRLIGVLEAVRRKSRWAARTSPSPSAQSTGGGVVRGRGVGVAIRHGSYLAGVAEVAVDLDTGAVMAERYWVVADVGVVVNPRLLRLNIEGGSVMGISQTLREEVQFDGSVVTSTNFRDYPILTMAETPDIEVELVNYREATSTGTASEPPNMVPPVAITAAFFDATGKYMRRLPMRPEYVLAELRDG